MGGEDPKHDIKESAARRPAALDAVGSETGGSLGGGSSGLHQLYERGQEAWPDVDLSVESFECYVTSCFKEGLPSVDAIEDLPADDLYLVCASLAGDNEAVRALRDIVHQVAKTAVGAVVSYGDAPEDLSQEFCERLFVAAAPGRAPLLARYNGTGRLRSWLRLMMVRRAVKLNKKQHKARPFEETMMDSLALDATDPELSYLKSQYIEEFRAAFKKSLRELEAREQNVLRYVVVEGLSVEQVARFFGVHRTTMSKRLQKIRQYLAKTTRKRLSMTLRVAPKEVDSIIHLVQSRLDITFTCLAEQNATIGS